MGNHQLGGTENYCAPQEPLTTKNILLTGATGVFGAHLMKELLASTDSKIFCLIRGKSLLEAQKRLHSFLKVYDTEEQYCGEFAKRVVPVFGDIVYERF